MKQETLNQFFFTSPDIVCVQDRQGRFNYVNPTAVEVLGFERLHLLGKTWSDLPVVAPYKDHLTRQLQQIFITGHRATGTIDIPTPHNTTRSYEYALNPIQSETGEIEQLMFMARDVTEQKQIEADLRASEEKYRSLFEGAVNIILISDAASYRILDANGCALRQLGYTRDELLQMSIVDIEVPMAAGQRAALLRHLETEGSDTFEHSYRRKDGTTLPVEISIQMIDYGDRLAFQSIARDIIRRRQAQAEISALTLHLEQRVAERTAELHRAYDELAVEVAERRKAEAELQEQQAFLRNVIDTCPSLIMVKDWDGNFTLVNQAVANAYGLPMEALLGQTAATLNPDSIEAQRFCEANREIMTSLQPRYIANDAIPFPSGKVHWFQTVVKPLIAPDGQARHVLVVCHDVTERKQIEQQLEAANAEMQALFAALDDLIVVCNRQGQQVKLLGNSHKLLYSSKEAQLGKTVHAVFPAAIADQFMNYIQQALDTQQTLRAEYKLTIDGQERWSDARISPIDENSVIWAVRDITHRKQVEADLLASEARYRAIVEDQSELVCRFLADGTLTFVNEAYCRMLGIQRDELLKYRYKMFLFVLDKPVAATLTALSPDQPVCCVDYQGILPDGSVRWQKWNNRAIYDAQGNLVEYQAIGWDITEYKRTEATLRETEERFRAIYEQAGIGIALVHISGEFLGANPRYCTIVGYSEAELMQQRLQTLTHPDDLMLTLRRNHQLLTGEITCASLESRYIGKDGQICPVQLSVSLVRNASGEPLYYLTFAEAIEAHQHDEVQQVEQNSALLWVADDNQWVNTAVNLYPAE